MRNPFHTARTLVQATSLVRRGVVGLVVAISACRLGAATLATTYSPVEVIPLDEAPQSQSGALPATGMGKVAAGLIEELWYAHFNDIFYTGSTPSSQSLHDSYAAAFQLTIWKSEYDACTTLDFSKGLLQVAFGDPDDLADLSVTPASNWLQSIDLNDHGKKANLLALSGEPNVNFQDPVVELAKNQLSPPGNVVPEQSNLLLLSLGALGMAAARRGRRRGQ